MKIAELDGWKKHESSNVEATRYSVIDGELWVKFTGRPDVYCYKVPPSTFIAMTEAPSVGKWFAANLRNRPDIPFSKRFWDDETLPRSLDDIIADIVTAVRNAKDDEEAMDDVGVFVQEAIASYGAAVAPS